jgi:PiT family inorganic phosphate transporter
LAFANGANDNFKATATLYGSGILGYGQARRLATVAQIAGSAASVVWADALLRAFGGKGLVPDAVVGDPTFLVAVGLGAAVTVLFASRVGLPISTTHVSTGALFGIGFWNEATDWSTVRGIVGAWIGTLSASATMAAAVAYLLG